SLCCSTKGRTASTANSQRKKRKRVDRIPERPARSGVYKGVVVSIVLLIVLLRVVALDSDAYPRLSWSSALLTDEGCYLHDARNHVLFGHDTNDVFHNRLIMPTLHLLQLAVFRGFGVGAVQARLISVGLSLGMLTVLFVSLRRAFGVRVAFVG